MNPLGYGNGKVHLRHTTRKRNEFVTGLNAQHHLRDSVDGQVDPKKSICVKNCRGVGVTSDGWIDDYVTKHCNHIH
jgi:hypothetical protein